MEELIEDEEAKTKEDKKLIAEMLGSYPDRDDFVDHFVEKLSEGHGDRVPYIKKATFEQKRTYAGGLWDFLQNRDVDEVIKRR